jgi:acetoin utilization protein AcuB
MTAEVCTVPPQTTIVEALRITRAQRIRHLPVVENERLVGLVTERDLRPATAGEAADPRTVGEIMVTTVITASSRTPIEEAAKLLYENRIGCLPVLEDDRLVGILTESDLLRALVELFGAHHPLTRLEVRMPNRAGELARVVRVIGIEHKVNIGGLIVPPSHDHDYSLAIVQLHTTNPLPIIEALRKLGYTVGWPSIEEDAVAPSTDLRHAPTRPRVPVEL